MPLVSDISKFMCIHFIIDWLIDDWLIDSFISSIILKIYILKHTYTNYKKWTTYNYKLQSKQAQKKCMLHIYVNFYATVSWFKYLSVQNKIFT